MNLYMFKAHCFDVIDGDTIACEIDHGFSMYSLHHLRLLDIDTPERGEEGFYEATEYTADKVLDKHIIIQTHKTDDFGRYLAKVFIPTGDQLDGEDTYECLNDLLLEEGLAKPYVG